MKSSYNIGFNPTQRWLLSMLLVLACGLCGCTTSSGSNPPNGKPPEPLYSWADDTTFMGMTEEQKVERLTTFSWEDKQHCLFGYVAIAPDDAIFAIARIRDLKGYGFPNFPDEYAVYGSDASLESTGEVSITDGLGWGDRFNDDFNHITVGGDGTVFVADTVVDCAERSAKMVLIRCDADFKIGKAEYLERDDLVYRQEQERVFPDDFPAVVFPADPEGSPSWHTVEGIDRRTVYLMSPPYVSDLETTSNGSLIVVTSFGVVTLFDDGFNELATYHAGRGFGSICVGSDDTIYLAGSTDGTDGPRQTAILRLSSGLEELNRVEWPVGKYKDSFFNDIAISGSGSGPVVAVGMSFNNPDTSVIEGILVK